MIDVKEKSFPKEDSPFGLLFRLSGKRDSSPRCARAIYRELYLHPQPLRGVASGEP